MTTDTTIHAEEVDTLNPSHWREAQQQRLKAVRDEKQQLSKQYRAARRAQINRVLDCPEGPRIRKMANWMRRLDIAQGGAVIEVVQRQRWLLDAPPEVRHTALSIFHTIITKKRENAGLHPFDDPLPGQPDNVFLQLKKLLRVT